MKPLRIGVDARELLGAATGVGRYLGELLLRWTARQDAERRRFLLYSPEPLRLRLPPGSIDQRVVASSGRGTWWEQIHLRRAVTEDQPDVFFAPANTAPSLARIPVALTIHDVVFVAHPEWFRMREGLRRRWLTRRAAKSASVIFTVSEFSRSEIQSHLQIDRERIRVVPLGAPFAAAGARGGPRDPLVLYVGSILNRRRLPDLIAAFARVVRDVPDARLAIVGEDRSWPPQSLAAVAATHDVKARVELRGYATNDELAALYARASVFAFLSEYEGFGLTPLEALAAGVPVVVADTPVAREVYGDAAHYVPAGDVHTTAEVLTRLLRHPGAADAVMQRAPAILARYSWDRCAADTLAGIEGIARR